MRFPWRRRPEELREELESHLDMAARDRMERGESSAQARAAAHREFGNAAVVREVTHDQWGWTWLENLLQDLRFGLRMLRKSPGFTTVAILTLALGIGANTTIFSFIDAVLLRSLPVKDPRQLVVITWAARHKPKISGSSAYGDCAGHCTFSLPFFKTLRGQASAFSGMAAFAGPMKVDFSDNGAANIAQGTFVSGDFFSTLGVKTILGRPLDPSDDLPSAPPAIVLDYGYWQHAFGGDRSAIGRSVRLNTTAAAIVGIADPQFTNLTPGKTQDFYMPFSLCDRVRSEWWGSQWRISNPEIWWVVMLGRLKPVVSIGQAQAAATTIFHNEMLHGSSPAFKKADAPTIYLLPARAALNDETSRTAPMLFLMMIAVGFVLLIACANVAGLTLARSATRQKEMAVRLALGAGPCRLIRQLLTEGILLSLFGGGLGVLLALWRVGAVAELVSGDSGQPFPYVVAPDWRVLVFTVAVTFATGILLGLAPALRSSRLDLTPSLKEAGSSLPGGAWHSGRLLRLSDVLVIAQVALSIVVLIGAGLLVRTLRNLQTLNPGFDTRNILLFGINPTIAGYTDQQTQQLYSNLQERLAALPGVISVSYSEEALLDGGWSGDRVHLDNAPPKQNVETGILPVGLDFFSTMHIPILVGRAFSSADFAAAIATNAAQLALGTAYAKTHAASPPAPSLAASYALAQQAYAHSASVPVLINESFARKYFPDQSPVDTHMGDQEGDNWTEASAHGPGYRIIGIVGDTKYASLKQETAPIMFLPLISNSAHFELRTAANPTALIQSVRGIVSHAGDNLPLTDVRTQTEQIYQTLFLERMMSQISSAFAALALILAGIGLYGLLSYEVARRTRELGIRMALGAQQRDLLKLVVGQGIFLVLVGAAIGIAAAMGVTRFMSVMLYGIHADDPLTFVGVAILLCGVALAACYLPARRAMKVDPMVALRYE